MARKNEKVSVSNIQRYVSIKEASAMLSLDASTVYRMVAAGELPAYRITARRVVISLRELDEFMQTRRTLPVGDMPRRERL